MDIRLQHGYIWKFMHYQNKSFSSIFTTHSAKWRRVRDCSARYDWAIQKTSPKAGQPVSRYNCDDCVKKAGCPKKFNPNKVEPPSTWVWTKVGGNV